MQNHTLTTTILKLVFGGQGFARIDNPNSQHHGKPAFISNALPGEEVEFQVLKSKKSFVEGITTKIITPSPKRIEPREEHFHSCSPFQVLEYDEENKQKVEMCKEAFRRIGKIPEDFPLLENLEIVAPKKEYGYRNKIEYNFKEDAKGKLQLAFFERNQLKKTAIEQCVLAKPEINKVAGLILEFARENNLDSHAIKSTIIRSNEKGEVVAGLYLKVKKDTRKMTGIPKLNKALKGFHIYLQDQYRALYTDGQDYLVHEIKGIKLKYGLNSFFQVNQGIFEKALDEIEEQLDQYIKTSKTKPDLQDFYSGVGAIGLPLHKKCKSVTLVDSNKEVIKFAKENLLINEIENARTYRSEAEKILEIITPDNTIILDPPRAGLHEDLTRTLLKKTPALIIYLSCNVSTQARDIRLLSAKYTIKEMKLFNFFPRTPHVESLCVLQRSTILH